jgi:hypothetical protein
LLEQGWAAWCLQAPVAPSLDGVMMKVKSSYCLLFLLVYTFSSAVALQASPQEALEEIATADKIDTVIKHLPVKVEEHLRKLPAKERAAVAEKLLLSKNLEREGGKLARSDDGSAWEVVEKEGQEKTVLTFKNTYISGANALVELEIKGQRHGEAKLHSESMFIGMRFEGGEWRVQQLGHWQKADLEEEFLRNEEPREQVPEAAAASTLRTLNTSIVTYMTTYPDQGCPGSLQALSGHENQESTRDHAMLLEPTFLQDPAIKNGYEFRYMRVDQEHYQITAIPLRWGDGTRSLFTDETALLRAASENRPANAKDPPLD